MSEYRRMPDKPHAIKGRMPLLIGLLTVILAMMWALGQCSHRRDAVFAQADKKADGDTMTVAIEMSPLLYQRKGDSISGLDYEIVRMLSDMHGKPVKFRPFVPLHFALDGLSSGKFDVVIAALPATERTRREYNMTDAVYTGRQALVQLRDSSGRAHITSQEQLAGHHVWIVEKSPYADRLKNLGAELGDTIYVHSLPEYSAEHLCLLTASGEIERAVVDEKTARRLAADYPMLDVSVPVSFNQFQSWAVGCPALRDSLNVWLDEFRRTSAYDSLLVRYGQR